ncbi:MAG: hypothetical protein ACK5YQ_07385 [Betaproteobacteria bacterium]|nr:hypothetical protein [Betaproteobacteria bacterium]
MLDYFHARKQFSSGVIEGLNIKARVTMRKAYAFRPFRGTTLARHHVLEKRPSRRPPTGSADEPKYRRASLAVSESDTQRDFLPSAAARRQHAHQRCPIRARRTAKREQQHCIAVLRNLERRTA